MQGFAYSWVVNKGQQLHSAAEGFMAGFVVCGYRGPWRRDDLDWKSAFYKAWRAWLPSVANSLQLPLFAMRGSGTSSHGRDMLGQLKATLPFHQYKGQPPPFRPLGLAPAEYFEIWVEAANPPKWIALSAASLEEMGADR